MKKYYEVRLAFNNQTQDVIITADELPSALLGFQHNAKVILSNGAFRGQDIISILPEKVLSMGWNRGHKPTPDDWNDITRELGNSLEAYMTDVKQLCYHTQDLKQLQDKVKTLPSYQKLLN